jgi:hypothetical protein
MPFTSLTLSGGGRKGVPLSSQQNSTRPFGTATGGLVFPEPPLQRGACRVIKGNAERCMTSLHGALLRWVVQCENQSATTLPVFPSLFNGDLY